MRFTVIALLLGVLPVQGCKGSEVKSSELTLEEKQLLDNFFLGSINVDKIKLNYGAYTNYTLGNTIYLSDDVHWDAHRDSTYSLEVLVHEAVHVWQFQHHPAMLAFGEIDDQLIDPVVDDREQYPAYHYELSPDRDLLSFGVEAQAEMLCDYFGRVYGDDETPTIVFDDNYGAIGREEADRISERLRWDLLYEL